MIVSGAVIICKQRLQTASASRTAASPLDLTGDFRVPDSGLQLPMKVTGAATA